MRRGCSASLISGMLWLVERVEEIGCLRQGRIGNDQQQCSLAFDNDRPNNLMVEPNASPSSVDLLLKGGPVIRVSSTWKCFRWSFEKIASTGEIIP